MNPNHLKNIYSESTEDFHNAMLCSLVRLNDKAQRRYKRHRILKTAAICVIIVCLCTTSVLAASNLYGIFTQKVSNYGMNVNVVPEENKYFPEYVKLKLGYLPEGVIETPNTNGEKYSLNGEAVDKNCSFSIIILDEEFNITNEYIINSTEKIINGNRVVINIRKFEDASDNTQTIFYEYFDELGAVLSGWCDNTITEREVEKIIEFAEVTEGTEDDHFERVDFASELNKNTQAINHQESYDLDETGKISADCTLGEYGKTFDYYYMNDDNKSYSINVESFEIHDNVSDLNRDNFNFIEYSSDLSYDSYFDENGDIISDYTRINNEYGDGINSIDKVTKTKAKRHFVLAKLKITGLKPLDDDNMGFSITELLLHSLNNNGNGKLTPKSDEYTVGTMVYNNGVDQGNNMLYIDEGETRNVVAGFFIDEEKIDNLYFSVVSRTFTAYNSRENAVCFPLKR